MNLDYFNIHWKRLALVGIGIGGGDGPLSDFLDDCVGWVKGGLLFYGKNGYEGEVLILKCDEDCTCYQRISNTGDDEKDWKLLGYLVEIYK